MILSCHLQPKFLVKHIWIISNWNLHSFFKLINESSLIHIWHHVNYFHKILPIPFVLSVEDACFHGTDSHVHHSHQLHSLVYYHLYIQFFQELFQPLGIGLQALLFCIYHCLTCFLNADYNIVRVHERE